MSDNYETKKLTAQKVACVRRNVAADQLAATFMEVFPLIGRTISAAGSQQSGVPFARYHSFSPESIDLEAGIPFEGTFAPSGEVFESELPAAKVVVRTFFGPYDELAAAHEETVKWLAENGFTVNDAPWESYVTDPGAEPDPSKWRTDLFYPVA